MAQLVLSVAGFAVGGPIGAMIGSAIGGFIDSHLLFDKHMQQEGPRLNDLRVTVSTYGQTIPLLYGPDVRIAGNVIWSSGLIETAKAVKQSTGKGGGSSVTTTTYSYKAHFAIAIAEGEISRIKRIWGDSKLLYDVDQTFSHADVKRRYKALRFYTGSASQMPDSLIQSYEGAANTPAYRHTAYVVFEGLELADFGNRIPNIEFEVEAHASITLPEVIRDLCTRSNVPPLDVVTSGLADEEVLGYAISRETTTGAALSPLAVAYNFDIFEYTGALLFSGRGRSPMTVIPQGKFNAKEATSNPLDGGGADDPISITRLGGYNLPKEVTVTFADPDRDGQPNSQKANRLLGNVVNNISQELPMVLTSLKGRQIAERILWEAWTSRTTAEVAVSDEYLYVLPGNVVALPVGSKLLHFRVNNVMRGFNGVIEWELVRQKLSIYDPQVVAQDAATPPVTVPDYGHTILQMLDIPILQDADDSTGFYYAQTGDTEDWPGGAVFRSIDGGTTYDYLQPDSRGGIMGTVSGTLAAGPTDFIDESNVITVTLNGPNAELSGVDEVTMFAGSNACWIGPSSGAGGEILQFRDATLVAPNQYELSGLLRGRLGTEANAATHGASEVFVFLGAGLINRANPGADDLNKSRLYKAVTIYNDIDDVTPQSFTNTGVGKKPLSPVHITGTRDTSNNILFNWARRSRMRSPGLGNGSLPLGEVLEMYEVDIYLGSDVVRTVTTIIPAFTYTAVEQAADGITPGDPVTVRVYQMSDIVGRGFPGIATV